MVLPDGWQYSEQTLAVNQAKSDWKPKQMKWNEELAKDQQNNPEQRILQDDEATTEAKKVVTNYSKNLVGTAKDQDSTIDLKPFELKAFHIWK